jgi:hypothetical protein
MEIGDFSEIMFVRNTDNIPLHINFQGIENNKDLFLCFIDLFCKGLVICYGNGNKSINFEDLDQEKFNNIRTKMACAGIIVNMDIIECPIKLPVSINSQEIEDKYDMNPLESYYFKIFNYPYIYVINFNLERV